MAVDNARIILTGLGALALAWGLALESTATEVPASPAASPPAGGHCAACHSGRDAEHVGKWRRSVHARAHVGCAGCHGGDESRQDKTGAHGVPQRGVTRSAAAACAACHEAVVAIYQTSRHAAAAARGKPAPGCADCHARAGSDLLGGGDLERRCATCHRTGGAAGKSWVPRKATAALDLLSQVSLARAMILEKLERRPAGNDTDALRRRLAEVDAGFKGIAIEWHRFSLHKVEALCISALDTLEAIYRDLDGRANH